MIDLLVRFLPKYTDRWMRWATRWPWLDAPANARRRRQHARALRHGTHPKHVVRNRASARLEGAGQAPAEPHLDVEVLITAYRYRDYLTGAVASAQEALLRLAADGVRGGIVVVEDCGRDGSWPLACSLAESASVPMRVLQPARNIGLAAARNLALFTSRTRSVFVLDADNRVYPDGLRRLWHTLNREQAAATYGPIDVTDESGERQEPLSSRPPDREWLMTRGNYIDAMALYDAETLKRIGGWSRDLLEHCWGHEDYELWIRLLSSGHDIAFQPQPIGEYRRKGDSMVNTMNPRTWTGFCAYMRDRYGPEFQLK